MTPELRSYIDRRDTAGTPNYTDWALHFRQIEEFVDAVHANRAPAIDGIEGRRAIATIEAIYRSQRFGRVIELT
jgi:predicted dehydrogenase